MQEFDFENWSELHSSDPVEFERRREAALREFIEQANPDSRLMLTDPVHPANAQTESQEPPAVGDFCVQPDVGVLRQTAHQHGRGSQRV